MRLPLTLCLLILATLFSWAETQRLMIPGSHGNLSAVIETPDLRQGQKCPMVMIMHGFMGSKDSPLEKMIAEKLLSAGIASIRFDFNGHGESEGEFIDMTVPNEIEDAIKVHSYVSGLPYVSSIGVTGHSQGGVVASMLAGKLGKKKIRSVVLMAPAAVLRDDAIRGNTMGKIYDPLNPPEYIEMWNGKKLGRDYMLTAFSLPIYETASAYTGHTCIIHGTGDRVAPYTYGLRFHDIWKGSEYHQLEAEDHGFSKDLDRAATLSADFLITHLK